jgi:hypothetical protein
MTLLFRLAEWHALAKLCMHTDITLAHMEMVTTILGRELCRFRAVTCTVFSTVELPKEAASHERKTIRKQAKTGVPAGSEEPAPSLSTASKKVRRNKKLLNLSMYKVHSLGDYVCTIRMLGTTDLYSTQTVRFIVIVYLDCEA